MNDCPVSDQNPVHDGGDSNRPAAKAAKAGASAAPNQPSRLESAGEAGDAAPDLAKPDHRFPKRIRVRKSKEFLAVYASRLFVSDSVLVINALANDLGRTRLGLSLSRKVGNAVMRNRWKRLIREAFRLHRHRLPSGWDLVVRPRKGAVPDRSQIAGSLLSLAQRVDRRGRRRS